MRYLKYLFFVFLFFQTAIAQIPNGGFEDWNGNNPVNWSTSNLETIYTNIEKSATAFEGNSSAKGTVISFFTTNIAPLLQSGISGRGFAVNTRYAGVTGNYQFFPVGNDAMALNFILYKGGIDGTPVAQAAVKLGAANSWQAFNLPFSYLTDDVPDTCILQIMIVGPLTGSDYHAGSYFLIDNLAFGPATDIEENNSKPEAFTLAQNYPNPFNSSTSVRFSIPVKSFVNLKIINLRGQEVATLVSQELPAGEYNRTWNALNMPSGTYFYRLQTGSFTETKKLVLLR